MMENKTKIDLKNTSIFITGAAGFIGSNLAKRILTTVEGAKVVGLDNMNHYYDVRLKEARLDELNKFENFSFVKGNLADYDGMYLGDGAVDQVVRQYGMERVGYILANTLRYKNYDDRFSHSNKEWAEQVGTPENNARIIKFRADWVVTNHSAVLDGFVTMYREKLEKQKEFEQPFVKRFYVVENRRAVPLEIKRFGNLYDAMSHYQALPYHYMKALGVEKNPDPLPGSLDILQCRNGIDTIVEDYKTVPGWDNPYIQNLMKSNPSSGSFRQSMSAILLSRTISLLSYRTMPGRKKSRWNCFVTRSMMMNYGR